MEELSKSDSDNTGPDNEKQFKYWAFISYSHQDEKWATWIHKTLEKYRFPKKLVGQNTNSGTVPRRIFPIFRDREELPTSADLGGVIRDALEHSSSLIVICSPNAAASHWVNEEVGAFQQISHAQRTNALIIDGEPMPRNRAAPKMNA